MKTATITSRAELKSVVEELQQYRLRVLMHGSNVDFMYRGHGRDSYKLLPTLVRNSSEVFKVKNIERQIITDFVDEVEKNNLSHLLQEQFLKGDYHKDWLLIQQAQHFGLPTRFMDWSLSSDVGLFFAVSNPFNDNHDGHLWVYIVHPEKLMVDHYESTHLETTPFDFDETKFLNSSGFMSDEYKNKLAERRKDIQHGRFLIQPFNKIFTPIEEQPEHEEFLIRITIPKAAKANLRLELLNMNYTKKRLYVRQDLQIENIVSMLIQRHGL